MTTPATSAPPSPAHEYPHYVSSILSAMEGRPDGVALHWRDRTVTAGTLVEAVVRAAVVLKSNGVGRGTAVGVLTEPNSPDTLVARYAANLLAAGVVHLRSANAASSAEVLPVSAQVAVLQEAGVSVLIVDGANADRAREIGARMPRPPAVACFGASVPGFLDLTESVAGDRPVGHHELVADGKGALGAITYTSGSTGQPKGIRRALSAWNHSVAATRDASTHPRMLVTTPLSHTVAPMVDATLASGGSIVLHEEFTAGAVLEAIAVHRITRTLLATPHIYQLLDHPDFASTDTSSLQQVMYGGCPASAARLEQAMAAFGPVLIQTYGTTESWGISVLTPPEHFRPELLASVGRPLPGVGVVIRDPETGQDLPVGATGEVCVRSPVMMTEYCSAAELTRRVLRDGWLHTGDLGHFDGEGYLYLVGRLSDVIKTNGVKIHPAAVENALMSHPGIAQAAVYGVRDTDQVEHVYAVVVPSPGVDAGSELTADRLRDHVAGLLSPQHAPAAVLVRTRIPLTASGKPDKRRLLAGTPVPHPTAPSDGAAIEKGR
ncbi:AMP-binding protein [Kitasatospora sp. NPDC018058]|uniref:AMP-binding protein n=1 Tax=Kitasatospora sp. NPDC018058 TaxID=3364025 RepID=UPI0037BED3E5